MCGGTLLNLGNYICFGPKINMKSMLSSFEESFLYIQAVDIGTVILYKKFRNSLLTLVCFFFFCWTIILFTLLNSNEY